MAPPDCEPTFEGIPTEIRVKIYKNLFSGLTLKPANTKPGDSSRDKKLYEDNMLPYLAATTVLGVSKKVRREALLTLENELTLVVYDAWGSELKPAMKFLPGIKKIRVMDLDRPRLGAAAFRQYLPKVELITYVQIRTPWWKKSLECNNWEDVFKVLIGAKDELLIRQFITYMTKLAPAWLPSPAVLPGQSPCKVLFEFPNMFLHWADSYNTELCFLYRLDVDISSLETVYRAINLGYDPSRAVEWVPAEDIVILSDGLKRPALFHPESGEIRALLERNIDIDNDDSIEDLSEADDSAEEQIMVLDYEKRGKWVNSEETDVSAIREVERQLANEQILRRALATAKPCIPTSTVSELRNNLNTLVVSIAESSETRASSY